MKILITSAFDDKATPCAFLTTDIMKEYSRIHGYECIIKKIDAPFVWSTSTTMTHINEIINNTNIDYVVWIDSDILIMNMNFSIESLIDDKEIIASSDSMGICLGFYIVKVSEWSKQCFKTLLFLGKVSLDTELITNNPIGQFIKYQPRHNQNKLKILCHYFDSFTSKISLIPENIIQNPSSQFDPNAFAIHFWGQDWNKQEKMIECINTIKTNGYYKVNNWWEL